MNAQTRVTAMIPAHNVERAVRWYEDKLGFKPARKDEYGANYDFKWIKLYGAFEVDKGYNSATLGNANNRYGGVKPTPSTDGREILLGFSAPVGPGTLMFSTQHKDDRTHFNQDAHEWGIGYLYALSRHTGLYAAYAHINNKNGAGYTVANNT